MEFAKLICFSCSSFDPGWTLCTKRWGIRTPKWQVVQKMCNEIDTNGNARIGQYTLSQALSVLFLDVLLFEMEA